MQRNEELDVLIAGYEPIGQMAIGLAYKLDYIGHSDYAIVNPRGDESSAGLPYFATDITYSNNQFQFSSYDTKTFITVEPNYQVLVYHKPDILDYPVETQIEMLQEFANQFAEGSLMQCFLTEDLIQWLRDSRANPDIHTQLCTLKEVAQQLDENLSAMDTLFKNDFPF